MSSRRSFLKKLGKITTTGVAVGWISPSLASSVEKTVFESSASEPGFWQTVEQAFHINQKLTYLNNGTIGPSPSVVEEAILEHMRMVNTSLRYGGGEDVREHIAEFINADKTEISLTHNTTEGINVAAWGLPLRRKDEVIITAQEHVGNSMPWINRSQHDGIVVKTFWPALTQDEVLNQIESLITKRTRVIAIPHISCTIGQTFPVKEICRMARDKGIYTVIDGAHGAGTLNLDMRDIDPDVYATCGHKWLLGPKGTGFLYVKKDMLDVIKPVFAGAYTDRGFDITKSPPTFEGYNPSAHRYDYGTQNAALRVGLSAAIDFHTQIGLQNIESRVIELNEYLYQKLRNLNMIELISSQELKSRSMMLGFKHKSIPFMELFHVLWEDRIRIRVVPESDLNSIRVSTHIYNNKEQLDLLVEALKRTDR